MTAGVRVRGNATAEELAAVVAVLSKFERGLELDRYAEWRRVRLAAVRAGLDGSSTAGAGRWKEHGSGKR